MTVSPVEFNIMIITDLMMKRLPTKLKVYNGADRTSCSFVISSKITHYLFFFCFQNMSLRWKFAASFMYFEMGIVISLVLFPNLTPDRYVLYVRYSSET